MKKLLILTVEWPYGKGETFFENEAIFSKGFDKIECIPFYKTQNVRNIPENITIYSHNLKINKLLDTLQGVFNRDFFSELTRLIKSKRMSLFNLKSLIQCSMMSNYRRRMLRNWLADNKNDDVTVYTYWMASDAVAVARTKRTAKQIKQFVTRCHRFDLYEYATEGKYIPYRKLILDNVDRVMAISNDAYDYLKNTYSDEYHKKLCISRLGTLDHGNNPGSSSNNEKFRIVSCSNLIKVKRVDLLISALSLVKHEIEWVHFGDGLLKNELIAQAKQLPKNVTYSFMGSVRNKDLMEWYTVNHTDVFINTSESEGIPVSIMEAMSFGIPVIATDVGGTGEIVKDELNGILVRKDVTAIELAQLIDSLIDNRGGSLDNLRKNARLFWEEHYNAAVNYDAFYSVYLQNEVN